MQNIITGGSRQWTDGNMNANQAPDFQNEAPVLLTNQDMHRFNIELEGAFKAILDQIEAG